jgi:DNA-binding transcriptional MerR regulator
MSEEVCSQGRLTVHPAIACFLQRQQRRLKFIRRAQELGFSLAEFVELLSLRVSRRTTSAHIRTRAQAKIVDIEAKIESLESMKKTLKKLTCPSPKLRDPEFSPA